MMENRVKRRRSSQSPSTVAAEQENSVAEDMISSRDTPSTEEEKTGTDDDPVDSESVKGIFGWETVDDTSIPYILRKKKKFVSVRIVERKLLSKYPNTFPDELSKKDPLVSYFITEAEANLLNEINTLHCDYEYGQNPFTIKDLIVDLEEFEEFFKIVKKTFPAEVLAKINGEPSTVPSPKSNSQQTNVVKEEVDISQFCGWIQINNTVSPYIIRLGAGGKQVKLVPLSVIVYAAGLLKQSNVGGLLPTKEECAMLNKACKAAGFDFTFGKNTRLISIMEVVERCQVQLFELPFKNPLQYARYLDPGSGQLGPAMLQTDLSAVAANPATSSSRDGRGRSATNPNPFLPSYQQANFPPGLARFPGAGMSVGMRLATSNSSASGMESGNLPVPPPLVSDKLQTMDPSHLASMAGSFWNMMAQQRGPPPAHMSKGGSSSKTPPVTPDPLQSSTYPPSSLPSNTFPPKPPLGFQDILHHAMFQSSANSSTSHPTLLSSQAGSKSGEMPTIRYPPPRIGLPQRPPLYSSGPGLPFGINQFNSALFARSDQPEASTAPNTTNNSSSSSHRRRVSRESPQQPGQPPALSPNGAMKPAQQKKQSSVQSKPASLSHKISACLVNGKSISCLQVDSGPRAGHYCLVEAVSKLYFPNVPLAEFTKVMQAVLQMQLFECTEEEESAFVQYYNLPVQKLKCNKIIRVNDLEKFFPQLNFMFTKCTESSSSSSQQPSSSAAGASKRNSAPDGTSGPPAKQFMPSLEHVVQKLHQGRDADGGAGRKEALRKDPSVIVIDEDD